MIDIKPTIFDFLTRTYTLNTNVYLAAMSLSISDGEIRNSRASIHLCKIKPEDKTHTNASGYIHFGGSSINELSNVKLTVRKQKIDGYDHCVQLLKERDKYLEYVELFCDIYSALSNWCLDFSMEYHTNRDTLEFYLYTLSNVSYGIKYSMTTHTFKFAVYSFDNQVDYIFNATIDDVTVLSDRNYVMTIFYDIQRHGISDNIRQF